jgi:uncharacterized protein with LGFP repeats
MSRKQRTGGSTGFRVRVHLILGAVVLAGAGLTVPVTATAAPGPGRAEVAERDAAISHIDMRDTGRGASTVRRTHTEPFSSVGISWPDAGQQLDGQAQIRARSAETGDWGAWQTLDADLRAPETAEGEDSAVRGGTQPRWVEASDGIEARVVAADGSAAGLPDDLRLDLIDPGVTPAETEQAEEPTDFAADFAASAPADGARAETAPAEAAPLAADAPVARESTVNQPPIVSRAGWGADESLIEEPSAYIERIDAAFVHHTTDNNSYSCVDSPAIVRSLMLYHVQSLDWNDIGYNFLVDKCGTVFEGRHGGIDQPVMGAHTYGFNSYSTGIAVIGNFATDGVPTTVITDAVARVAAWKLGQYGVSPTGSVTLTAGGDTGVWDQGERATLRTISGHRDGFATECPGDSLYAKLGDIRTFAAGPGANSAAPTSDVNGDGVTDLVTGTPKDPVNGQSWAGSVHVLSGGREGPVAASRLTLTQSTPGIEGTSESGDSFGAASDYGDVNGDGYADLVIGAPGEDVDGHADAGSFTVVYGPDLATGVSYTAPPNDLRAGARFGSAITVGDFDSDGTADVFTASEGSPGWWAFDVADGTHTRGGLPSGSAGPNVSYLDATTGDFTNDGYADAVLNYRDSDGNGRLYHINGSAAGLTSGSTMSTPGGRAVASGDTDADGHDDLVIGQPQPGESNGHTGGQVTVVRGSDWGFTGTGKKLVHQDSASVPGTAEPGDDMGASVSVGDFDLDGRADVLTGLPGEDITRDGVNQANTGATLLLPGSAAGVTGAGSVSVHQDTGYVPGSTEPGDGFGWSVQLADLSGWGRADLAIGADGENGDDGMIFQIDSGSAGLGFAGTVLYTRGTFGTPAGARIGWSLTP